MSISDVAVLAYQQKKTNYSYSYQSSDHLKEGRQSFEASFSIESSAFSLTALSEQKGMQVLYEQAIISLNIELQVEHGDEAIQKAYEQGIDFSPEATAKRIVGFATSFLDSFRANHQDLSEDESLTEYMTLISGAIDKGFNEAIDILSALSVYDGMIKQNAEQTYQLVQEGLTNFKQQETPDLMADV